MSTPVSLLLGVFLLAANGFFVAAEFALLSASRSRIDAVAESGSRSAKAASKGLKELSLMLAGAQVGITMCSLALGAIAEPAIAHLIEVPLMNWGLSAAVVHVIAFSIALSIVVFLHMVVGEMAPKSWAISHPEKSVLILALPFRAFVVVVRPFVWLINTIGNSLLRLLGVTPQAERAVTHSATDLIYLVRESTESGEMKQAEGDLVARSLELSGLDAADTMTPRRDLVSVSATASVDEIEEQSVNSGRSRLLVYEGDPDHPVGAVHVREVLLLGQEERRTVRAGALASPVLVTHRGRAAEDLLLEMQQGQRHLAVVIDELGSLVGVVTMEDILEEIIGDFDDETDQDNSDIKRIGLGCWKVNGSLRPDEVAEATGVALPEGEWDTVAGFVISTLDRIPSVGDSLDVGQHCLTVEKMDGFAIEELLIEGGHGAERSLSKQERRTS